MQLAAGAKKHIKTVSNFNYPELPLKTFSQWSNETKLRCKPVACLQVLLCVKTLRHPGTSVILGRTITMLI